MYQCIAESELKKEQFLSEWLEMLKVKSPILSFSDFDFDFDHLYIDYDQSSDKLLAGSVTNCGLIPDFELDIDYDFNLDANLEELYTVIIENSL